MRALITLIWRAACPNLLFLPVEQTLCRVWSGVSRLHIYFTPVTLCKGWQSGSNILHPSRKSCS